MDAELPAATTATAAAAAASAPPRAKLHERYAAAIVWFSLFTSVVGLLSALHDMLAQLSIFTKVLFATYHIAREALWRGACEMFGWIHIHIPDIPDAWKDTLVIIGLVLAALNFESVRWHRKSLIKSFAENVTAYFRYLFLADDAAMIRGLFVVDDGGEANRMMFQAWLPAFWLEGYLGYQLDRSSGLDPISLGVLLAAFVWAVRLHDERLERSALGRAAVRLSDILYFPVVLFGLLRFALYNGWRAIVLALGLVVVFVGLNFAVARWIDPMLKEPRPFQWIIDADPTASSAAPAPHCPPRRHCGP